MDLFTFIVLISLIKRGDFLAPIVKPVNTAVTIGSNARLNCTYATPLPPTAFVKWFKGSTLIFSTVDGKITDPSLYEIKGSYDLIVKSVTQSSAGKYRCEEPVSNNNEFAELVVIDPLGCSTSKPDNMRMRIGQSIILTCMTRYSGYFQPTLKWYTKNNLVMTSKNESYTDSDERKYVKFTTNFTVNAQHDMANFTCRLYFTTTGTDTQTPPDLRTECSTNFEVLHGPSRINFSPDPDDYPPNGIVPLSVGQTVNVSSDGRPKPEYTWYTDGWPNTRSGERLLLTKRELGTRTFICRAENRERSNVVGSAERNITLRVTHGLTSGSKTFQKILTNLMILLFVSSLLKD